MPDATDRPASSNPNAADPVLRRGIEAPPPPADAYRPLSLLALVGFAIAVLYATLVVGGGIISFVIHVPWLLSFWAVLLPMAALAVCLIARQRIRDSEGTVSGESLTTAGILVSIVVGLAYAAYYTGTRFAVTKQATSWVENVWFEHLRRGDVDKAFLLTLVPPRPPENDLGLRDQLEMLHNSNEELTFSMFPHSPHIHAILEGGGETTFDLVGVQDWGFESGGYRVRLLYKVATPYMAGQLQVVAQSHEGGTKEAPGRQWYVLREGTGALKDEPLQPTARGQKLFALANQGHFFAQSWIEKLDSNPAQAFLDTLPVNERFQYRQGAAYLRARNAGAGAAGLGFLAAEPANARAFRNRLASFRDGALLVAKEPAFWCMAKNRDPLLHDMRNAFRREGDQPTTVQLMQTLSPLWKEEGDLIHFRYELDMKSPRFRSEGALVVAGKLLPDGDPSPQAWRVEAIELARGGLAARDEGQRPGPGAGRMQGMGGGGRPRGPSPRR